MNPLPAMNNQKHPEQNEVESRGEIPRYSSECHCLSQGQKRVENHRGDLDVILSGAAFGAA